MIKIEIWDGSSKNFYSIINKFIEIGFNPSLIEQDYGLLRTGLNPKYKDLSFFKKFSVYGDEEDATVFMHYSKYSRGLNPVYASVRQIVEIGSYYWLSPCLEIESTASIYKSDGIFMKLFKIITGMMIKDKPSIISDLRMGLRSNELSAGKVYRLSFISFYESSLILNFTDAKGKTCHVPAYILGYPKLIYTYNPNH